MPKFWRSWLYQLDPFTRLIGGMVVTELHSLPVICRTSELNTFTSPAGQTCGEYMAAYFAGGGNGYLVNNDTQNCGYCAYDVGDEFYKNFGLSFGNRWRDLGILAAFVGSNLVFLFVGVSPFFPLFFFFFLVAFMMFCFVLTCASIAVTLSQLQQKVKQYGYHLEPRNYRFPLGRRENPKKAVIDFYLCDAHQDIVYATCFTSLTSVTYTAQHKSQPLIP